MQEKNVVCKGKGQKKARGSNRERWTGGCGMPNGAHSKFADNQAFSQFVSGYLFEIGSI